MRVSLVSPARRINDTQLILGSDQCVVDPFVSASLERTKQWWLLIDASKPALSTLLAGYDSDMESDVTCPKTRKWLREHSEYVDDHPECKDIVRKGKSELKDKRRRLRRQAHKRRKNDKSSVGPFFLIPVDHLLDMQTRALTGSEKRTVGGYRSTRLDALDPNDPAQQWYLDPA